MKYCIFRCVSGFGNKINNIINLFYFYDRYQGGIFYIDWVTNNHFSATFESIYDSSSYNRIHLLKDPPSLSIYGPGHTWAHTTLKTSTKWDDIKEWDTIYLNHSSQFIVSTSYLLYDFIPLDFARKVIQERLVLHLEYQEKIKDSIATIPKDSFIIHMRFGDLIRIYDDEKGTLWNTIQSDANEKIQSLEMKFKNIPFQKYIFQNDQGKIANRDRNMIQQTIIDFYTIIAFPIAIYCPFSTFSSLMFIACQNFDPSLPLFESLEINPLCMKVL